jgi:hypothetical protein
MDRGCPWMTAADRYVGHAGGTADERRWPPLYGDGSRVTWRVRLVRGQHSIIGDSAGSRQADHQALNHIPRG